MPRRFHYPLPEAFFLPSAVASVHRQPRPELLFGRQKRRLSRVSRPLSTQMPRETVWKILSTSQPSYHEPCHRDIDKRFSGGAQPLVVLAHPPVLREPREGALHNPAAREDLEAPARKQLLPIDRPALFRPLLRPHHCDLLWRRLGSAMHDLDAQVQLLFHPVLAPALVPGIYP